MITNGSHTSTHAGNNISETFSPHAGLGKPTNDTPCILDTESESGSGCCFHLWFILAKSSFESPNGRYSKNDSEIGHGFRYHLP